MKSVQVLSGYPLSAELEAKLRSRAPEISVHDVSSLLRRSLRWSEPAGLSDEEGEGLRRLLRDAEVLVLPRPPKKLPPVAPRLSELLSESKALRWVHYVGAGLDHFSELGLWGIKATLTNSAGVAAIPIAEHVLYLMLLFARRARESFANQVERRWERIRSFELRGRTLGIVGFGHIGQECARLAKGLGMRVLITRRSEPMEALPPIVDQAYPRGALLDMVALSDFVLLALPLTPESEGMIGAPELKAMKSGAYLINVARGRLVDESALIQALEEGRIAGAGLDVFVEEPLPPDSPLWSLPNAIITCHASSMTGLEDSRTGELLCENLDRFLEGRPLLNIVEEHRGY